MSETSKGQPKPGGDSIGDYVALLMNYTKTQNIQLCTYSSAKKWNHRFRFCYFHLGNAEVV